MFDMHETNGFSSGNSYRKQKDMSNDDSDARADRELGLRRLRSRTRTLSWNELTTQSKDRVDALPKLSDQATLGRNSSFHHLSPEDRESLGGSEYKALKLLLKTVLGYFFGLHLFGIICLVPWIHRAPPRYTEYLEELEQNRTWWYVVSPLPLGSYTYVRQSNGEKRLSLTGPSSPRQQ